MSRNETEEQVSLDEELRSFVAKEKRLYHLALLALVGVAGVYATYAHHGDRITGTLRGDISVSGEYLFNPELPIDETRAARIDFDRLHTRLIPRWMVALSKSYRSSGSVRQADRAFRYIKDTVRPDPLATQLFTELHHHLREAPVERAGRIDYLLWSYNEYLDRLGEPWRVEGAVTMRSAPVFHTRSYRVLHDELRNGERVRVLKRADFTNVVENYLGKTRSSRDGAIVVVDRVAQFVAKTIWPLLSEDLDSTATTTERAFAPIIREQAKRALGEAHFAALADTADEQRVIVRTIAAIEARNKRCDSRVTLRNVPFDGLSEIERDQLRAMVLPADDLGCTPVTAGEAANLVGASERLEQHAEAGPAFEALLVWAAESVALHEVEHVTRGDDTLSCQGCEHLSNDARHELAAYLTAFSDPNVGGSALLQACAMDLEGETPNREALEYALPLLLPEGCGIRPTEDPRERAVSLRLKVFESAQRERPRLALGGPVYGAPRPAFMGFGRAMHALR